MKKYTPIICKRTGVPIKLDDFVEDLQGRCGVLAWDSYLNKYFIKTAGSGRINTTSYIKIRKPYKYSIDTTTVECRKSHLKQKW